MKCVASSQRLGLGPGAVLVGSPDKADRFTNPASQHRNAFSGLGGTHDAGPCCPCVWGRWWYECSAGHAHNCNYKYEQRDIADDARLSLDVCLRRLN
jgi:hypothetical protein